MWVFDIKKEEKRIKGRQIISIHAIDSFALLAHYSFIQNLSIRLLLLITEDINLKVAAGDAVNIWINANNEYNVHSRLGNEWDDKLRCNLEIIKSLNGLNTSSR